MLSIANGGTMTIRDEVRKRLREAELTEITPRVEITESMRKEIVDILVTNQNKQHKYITVSVYPITTEVLDNPFWIVKQTKPATWYRKKPVFEITYRKGSLRKLLNLLDKEGVGSHVEELGLNTGSAVIAISLKRDLKPYSYVMSERNLWIERFL